MTNETVRVMRSSDPARISVNFAYPLIQRHRIDHDAQFHYKQVESGVLIFVRQGAVLNTVFGHSTPSAWPLTTSRCHRDGSITFYAQASVSFHNVRDLELTPSVSSDCFIIKLN